MWPTFSAQLTQDPLNRRSKTKKKLGQKTQDAPKAEMEKFCE